MSGSYRSRTRKSAFDALLRTSVIRRILVHSHWGKLSVVFVKPLSSSPTKVKFLIKHLAQKQVLTIYKELSQDVDRSRFSAELLSKVTSYYLDKQIS